MRRLPLALAAAIAVAAVVAATAPPASAAPGDVTAVTYDSSNNAYYAPSSSQLADASRGQQVVVKRWTGKGVEIDTPAQYELVPGGADLAVGEYDVGTGPGQVRFVKYNEDCDNQTGHLSIRDFAATADAVQRLDATLQVNCTYNRITSEIRWHVDNPYRSARTTGQFRLPDGALGQDRSEALTLYATGMLPVTFGTPRFEGADAAAFSYSDDTCDGRTVPVGGSCTIVLHARPTHDQVSRTRLTIPDDTVHGARVLGVEAWVVPPPAAPSITVSAGYDGLGIRANASNMSASGQTTSFRFYRVTPTGDQGIGEAPAGKDGSGFVTDPLPPGASGTYRAVAVGPGGESGSSPNASGTVPVRAVPAAGDQTVSIVDRRLGVDIKTDTTVTAVPGAIRFMTGTSGDVTIAWTGDLAPGTYTTTTYPPGSSASSGNATAAVRITQPFCYGRQDLTVHESAVHANGTPDVLAATFHFACDDGTVLAGELRWHANTPYKVSQANTLGLQIGHQPVNTTTKHSVVITNRGTASLTIGTPAISSDEETYSVSGTTCGGPMAPGASCTVDVAAHPKTYGDHMAYVVVPDDSAAGRRDVRLYLQATTVPATPYTWVAPVIDRVQLRWEPVLYDSGGEQVTGYEIWRGPVGGALTRLASVNVSTSVYDDRGVRQGETWQYAVRARNSVGLSAMDPKTGDVPDVEVLMASDRGPSRIGQPLAAAADEIPVSWQSPDGLSGPSGMLSASADGSRVAYSSRPPQSSEYRLVVAAGDGSNPRTITSGHWDLQPTFSPDGRTLAFLREDQSGHNPQLWTVPVGGGTARRVPMADAPTAPAQWVSASSVVTTVAVSQGVWRVVRVDMTTGAETPVVGAEDVYGPVAVSADRRTLCVAKMIVRNQSGDGPAETRLMLLPVDGGAGRLLTTSEKIVSAGAFRPDGTSVFFTTHPSNWTEVAELVLADGREIPWTQTYNNAEVVTGVRARPHDVTPVVSLAASTISAGQRVVVTYRGAPNTTVQILSKTQPAASYRVIGTVVLDASGVGTSSHAPQRNTRIMARTYSGLESGQPLISVRSVASISATRVGMRTYSFTGKVYPALTGRVVRLYGNGALVASARCDSRGTYTIRKTFPAGTASFQVRTANDAYNLAATSPSIRVRIY